MKDAMHHTGEEEETTRLYEPPQVSLSRELEKRERGRLRLVIAIPALMVLITLTSGIISYELVLDMTEHTDSLTLKAMLEGAGNKILLANFLACGIALVFGVGLATYIIRPIRAITQEARKLASGDLSLKVQVSSPDELGELGESFNTLIDHLSHLFKERDRYILEGLSEGLISTGAAGEVLAINTQAEKILGLKADQMIGQNLNQILGSIKQDNATFNTYIRKSMQDYTRMILDKVLFVNAKGNQYKLSMTSNPIKDKRGYRMGCIITLRDLAILDSFAEQIHQADRLAAIGSFATGIAHELRNPLGSIKGIAQLVSENPRDERIRDYASLIIGEVDRLDRVIRTILDFAQPEPEPAVPVDLNTILDRALNEAGNHPSVQKNLSKIRIEKKLGEIPPCSVQPGRITQAFSNIILNAFQALERGGKVEIMSGALETSSGAGHVEVRIANDGPCIIPEHHSKIFEPFFTTRSDGTGLGLPLSYQIIVSNDGTLDVDSSEDITVFIVSFPAFSPSREEAGETKILSQ